MTVEEEYDIYLAVVTGAMSEKEAAERSGVDRSTVARIRKLGEEAVLEALANSRPGRRKAPGSRRPLSLHRGAVQYRR